MSRPACQHGVPTIYDCPDCEVQALDDEIVRSAALVHRKEYPVRQDKDTPQHRELWKLLGLDS